MKTITLKHSLFKCELPEHFQKKFPESTGCCAFSPFHFPPFPETFRTEFWFTLGKKEDVTTTTGASFSAAYAKFIQEGFTTPFSSKDLIVQSYKALQLSFLETKTFQTQEGKPVAYDLETQAIAIFLDEQHILHLYCTYDIAEKEAALHALKRCLNSLEICGDTAIWHKIIEKEKAENDAFWAEQEEKERLEKRSQRVIEDEKFGTLKPNPNLKPEENTWWTSEMTFDSFQFKWQLNLGTNDNEEDAVRSLATQVLADFEANETQAKQHITDAFLELYNDGWRQTDDAIITENEFKKRIKIETVEVDKNLECRFWYNDDDMFGQHGLLVNCEISAQGKWVNEHTEMFG